MTHISQSDLLARAQRCVVAAVEELNALRAADAQLSTDGDSALLGEGGQLDSLGFVNLAVALDTQLEREFGGGATVMADLLSAADPSEFATVDALSRFAADRTQRA